MTKNKEEWRTTKRDSNYLVSNLGNVRRVGGVVLKPYGNYPTVVFGSSCKRPRKQHYVHQLVLEEFCGERPKGFVANHKDGNKYNNKLDNLEWCSQTENKLHAYRTGLMPLAQAKLTVQQVEEIRFYSKLGESKIASAKRYGVTTNTVYRIITHRTWKTV